MLIQVCTAKLTGVLRPRISPFISLSLAAGAGATAAPSDPVPAALDAAGKAIATAQGQVFLLQVLVTILVFVLGLVGAYQFFSFAKARRRFEFLWARFSKLRTLRMRDQKETERLQTLISDLEAELQRTKESIQAEFATTLDGYRAELRAANTMIDTLESRAAVLNDIIVFRVSRPEKALPALQRLSQRMNPIAIDALISVLEDVHFEATFRIEAAYGLGRFSEQRTTEREWAAIVESLRRVMATNPEPAQLEEQIQRSFLSFPRREEAQSA